MAELWDAYDKNFKRLEGVTLTRGERIPDGLYHLVCDILVRHTDGTYLIMQRDSRKSYGGMWEATAGGSALKGETPLQAAIRELREETGIFCEDLRQVAEDAVPETHSYYVEFFCTVDCAKDSVTLQEGETSAYRWVTKEELFSMMRDKTLTQKMKKFIAKLQ